MASHVDLKSRVAREHFKADLTGRLTTRCKNIFHQWICWEERKVVTMKVGANILS